MTQVIKSDDRAGSTRIGKMLRRPSQPHPVEIERDHLREEVTRLTTLIEQLKHEQELRLKTCEKETEARVRAEVRESHDRADAALENACIEAVTRFSCTLDKLADQAPVLAVEALRPLLGDAEHRLDLIASTVEHQLSELRETAIIEIQVSEQDFDRESARALKENINGAAKIRLEVETALASGEVIFRLKLGALELSLDEYWQRIRRTMESAQDHQPHDRGADQ